jgi:integrase
LRRLAIGCGIEPADVVVAKYVKREYQKPYTDAEVRALKTFLACLSNQHRRLVLAAVLSLGLGCGLRSHQMRKVTVDDVHTHEDAVHVRLGNRCVPVQSGFGPLLQDVATMRGTGILIGAANGHNSLTKVASWVRDWPGVPELSVYRLRSTWLCDLLASEVALTDVMAWAGLTKFAALDGYRPYLRTVDITCPQ